ncbi:hypothetical protein ACIGEL_17720 [Rossellomorea aquimaris]|uniref:hypothetical protein n=1 Tax=Rossellomorea aquimaris TaxID=189382 RepID=UPI0037C93BE7
MLTFNEVRSIFLSYPELKETQSGDRYSYSVRNSIHRGKLIAREIRCNQDGTFYGYISSKYMSTQTKLKYVDHTDSRGMIKIKTFSNLELHNVIRDAIFSMGHVAIDDSATVS